MTNSAECDEKCLKAKKEAEQATNKMMDAMDKDLLKMEKDNNQKIAVLKNLAKSLGNGDLDDILKPLETLSTLNVTELQTQMDNKVEQLKKGGKLAAEAAKALKTQLHDALARGKKSFGLKDFKFKFESGLSGKLEGCLKKGTRFLKQNKKFKKYRGEVIRRLSGMKNLEQLGQFGSAAGNIASAVGKFSSGDAMQIASGVLDVANAVAQFLPPPASIVTGVASGIFGMFMPGAGGPEAEEQKIDVVGEMEEMFKKQNQVIAEEFKKQKKFILEQFEKAVGDIKEYSSIKHLKDAKTSSIAILDYIEEKQAYLFKIDAFNMTENELTRITSDLQFMDNTKDISVIRNVFLEDCVGPEGPITTKQIQYASEPVNICLIIFYNYLTVEKYRKELMERFLALRNMVPDHNGVTAAYWEVAKARDAAVADFITNLVHYNETEASTDVANGHTDEANTALKMKCYIGGDEKLGTKVLAVNAFKQKQRREVQEYVKAVSNTTYTSGQGGPCDEYNQRCK